MGISDLSLTTVLYNLSLFVLFFADIFYSFWTFIIKIQLFWFSSDKSLSFFFFDRNWRNSIKGDSLSLIRKWTNRVVSFSYFSDKFMIRISWKYLQHSLSVFIVFALSLDNEENAIDHLSFQAAGGIVYFKVEHFKRSFGGVIKFWWSSVCMHYQVY